jgi:hypothetical protein
VDVQGGTGDADAAVQALPWRVHTASAPGAWHIKDGRPNEDAVAHQLIQPPDGSQGPGRLVVAVADGHGDARHFRSDRGSAMAVAAGIAALSDWSADLPGTAAEIKRSAQRELVPDVVDRWNAAVAADLAADEFTATESALLAELRLPPPTAYGSTLLIGAFTGDYAVFAQIGDGNTLAVLPDGLPFTPVPDDSALDGTHTTSLCQPTARASFRVGVIQLADRPIFAALLATDGFGNAQAEDPWQPGVAADLARFGLDHDEGWFASAVPKWAAQCASSNGSGDDSTIALVVNPAAMLSYEDYRQRSLAETIPARTLQLAEQAADQRPAAAATAATVPPRPAAPAPAADQRPERGRGRGRGRHGGEPGRRPRNRAWAWIATAAVLAVGVLLAFLLTGRGSPGPTVRPGQHPTAGVSPRHSASTQAASTQAASTQAASTPAASTRTSPPGGVSSPKGAGPSGTVSSAPASAGVSTSAGDAGGAANPTAATPQPNR